MSFILVPCSILYFVICTKSVNRIVGSASYFLGLILVRRVIFQTNNVY